LKESLHKEIEILRLEPTCIELRDRRTQLHICVNADDDPCLMANGDLSQNTIDVLRPLGLLTSLPTPALRKLQRPFRVALQSDLRDGLLRDYLAFAKTKVPFYRDNPLYDLGTVTGTCHLPQLPTLRKPALREHFDKFLADSAEVSTNLAKGRFALARTSGTADERIQVVSDLTLDHVPPDYQEVWGVDFHGQTPRTAILTSPLCSATECHLGVSSMAERTKFGIILYLNSTEDLFSASDALVRNIVGELEEFAPHILLVNPYYLLWIGRAAQHLGLRLPVVDLILASYQYLPKAQRRALAELFDAPVYNIYTATELCGCMIGVECKNGRWHVFEDHTILEILDSQPKGNTAVGSVIVTPVAGRVMPLIRYEVGDLARAIDFDCDCPLSDWQCFEFHGRKKDTLCLNGHLYTTREIDEIVSNIGGIDFYECVQDGDSSITIYVVSNPASPPCDQDVAELMRLSLGLNKVSVHLVSRLEPERSMKFRLTRRDIP
jgi:phenylacetate-CoA ligase